MSTKRLTKARCAELRVVAFPGWPGFALVSDRPGESCHHIEVKGWPTGGDVQMETNEWSRANHLGDEYWLYVLLDCAMPNRRLLPRARSVPYVVAGKRISIRYTTSAKDTLEAAVETRGQIRTESAAKNWRQDPKAAHLSKPPPPPPDNGHRRYPDHVHGRVHDRADRLRRLELGTIGRDGVGVCGSGGQSPKPVADNARDGEAEGHFITRLVDICRTPIDQGSIGDSNGLVSGAMAWRSTRRNRNKPSPCRQCPPGEDVA